MDVLMVLTALPHHPDPAAEYAPRPVQLSWYQADDAQAAAKRSLPAMKTSARSSTPNFLPCKEAAMTLITSNRRPEDAVYRHVIPAGNPGCLRYKKGKPCACSTSRQAIDTLFYNADNPRERYDPQRTLRRAMPI
jgi:uncharacterized protein YcgI (DUF1989 family)